MSWIDNPVELVSLSQSRPVSVSRIIEPAPYTGSLTKISVACAELATKVTIKQTLVSKAFIRRVLPIGSNAKVTSLRTNSNTPDRAETWARRKCAERHVAPGQAKQYSCRSS